MKLQIAALLFVLSASPALASPPPERSQPLMQLLLHIDHSPTRAELLAAGSGEQGEALVAIAKDATVLRYARLRAAGALSFFDTAWTKRALEQLLDDPAVEDREVRIQALAALTYLSKNAVTPRLEALLQSTDVELRAAAVRNLGRLEDPRAARALTAFVRSDAEQVPWVRALAAEKLEALEARAR